MPRIVEPSVSRVGPLGKKAKNTTARRLRTKQSRSRSLPPVLSYGKPPEEHKTFIGEDLLEWHGENFAQMVTPKASTAPIRQPFQPSNAQRSKRKEATDKWNEEEHTTILQNHASLSCRAIGMDTRCVQLDNNKAIGDITMNLQDLILTLVSRGATPCVLASTLVAANKTSTTTTVTASGATKKIAFKSGIAVKVLVGATSVVSPVNVPMEQRVAMIPKVLTAEHSWTLLGEMGTFHTQFGNEHWTDKFIPVDTIVANQSKPLDISLVGTDVSLFCDTNIEQHLVAVEHFVDHVAPLFRQRLIASLQIVIAKTGAIVVQADEADNNHKDELSLDVTVKSHEASVVNCIDAIQAKLDELEFASTSRMGTMAASAHGNAVSVSLLVIESCFAGFKYLSRQLVRDSLLLRRSRLSFDLPETPDGSQCSISFDATYQIFPFPIQSPQAKALLADLDLLSHLDIRVTRLVPLASLDASLLFGVPIVVQASFESDYAQFHEMQALVRSLFGTLQQRELALLLRGKGAGKNNSGNGLFPFMTEQYFVLIAQESPRAPSSGLLFRIAGVDQLLTEAISPAEPDLDVDGQYNDYLEEAFGALDCSAFNPIEGAPEAHSTTTITQRDGIQENDPTLFGTTLNENNPVDASSDSPMANNSIRYEDDIELSTTASIFNDTVGVGSTVDMNLDDGDELTMEQDDALNDDPMQDDDNNDEMLANFLDRD